MDGETVLWMMFTYDPTFDPRGKRWGEVCGWCRQLGLNPDHIVYQKSDRKYCAEAHWQLSQFQRVHARNLRGARLLRDGGPAYRKHGIDVFEELCEQVAVLESATHGPMSPCDNKFNSVMKTQWRAERESIALQGATDYAYESLLLAHQGFQVGSESIRSFWNENFMLDKPDIRLVDVEDMLGKMGGKNERRQEWFEHCAAVYKEWADEYFDEEVLLNLCDDLDGRYWK